jgi:RNA polymerase sigma factor (sigma-70 family)
MPDYEKYLKEKERVAKIRNEYKHSSIMNACYQEPVLSKKQIIHLFRHYNYLKFCIRRYLMQYQVKPTNRIEERIEKLYNQAIEMRNFLATANFRLVGMIKKQITTSSQCDSDRQDFIAELYASIVKAIDYFDYRRGFNFSTYATWAVRNNFYKSRQENSKTKDKEYAIEKEESIIDRTEKSVHEDTAKLVNSFLEYIPNERQRMIIEKLYGLNDPNFREGRTLEDVGKELGISKERVRQIKLDGLLHIQKRLAKKDQAALLQGTSYEDELHCWGRN